MSKTSRTTYKNKETEDRKGKVKYRERLISEELLKDELEDVEKLEKLLPDEEFYEHE